MTSSDERQLLKQAEREIKLKFLPSELKTLILVSVADSQLHAHTHFRKTE